MLFRSALVGVVVVVVVIVVVLQDSHQEPDHGVFFHGLIVEPPAEHPTILDQVVLGELLEVVDGRFIGDEVVIEVDGLERLCISDFNLI